MKKTFFVMSLSIVIASLGLMPLISGCKKEGRDGGKETVAQVAEKAPRSGENTLIEYTFENGIEKWMSFGKNHLALSTEKKHSGNSSLKISGPCYEPAWNYAVSPTSNLEPNKNYRLSCWMLVESLSDLKLSPFIKCDTSAEGNKNSKGYNLANKNEWQQLSVEFTTKAANKAFIAIEKGTNTTLDATIYIDDVKLEVLK